MAEPLACVLHALDRARMVTGYPVVVIGAGPIGLMAAHLARLRGASAVIVIEANEARVERTRTLGFECRTPVESDAELADYIFECAGNPRAMEYALKVAKPGGTIVWVGVAAPEAEVCVRPFDVSNSRSWARSSTPTPRGVPSRCWPMTPSIGAP